MSRLLIQLVVGARADERSSEPRYLPWAGYTQPMTGDQAMRARRECELRWPEYEFRAHPIDDGDSFSIVGAEFDRGRSTGLW
ncbi:hypothetical protein BRCH_00807c [Candidatus Burkholderia brachyanthoides]|nr:hypothetical protein BRCH_00807c [Candidatus Burkholderia brachyanthoides]